MTWHGYFLLKQPGLIASKDWGKLAPALVISPLNSRPQDPQPSHRLHMRQSLDGAQLIVEADFDDRDLLASDDTRLPKYLADIMGLPVVGVKNSLAGNFMLFAEGKDWEASRLAALAHMESDLAAWENEPVIAAELAAAAQLVGPERSWQVQAEWVVKRAALFVVDRLARFWAFLKRLVNRFKEWINATRS
jgi:hypothetical protein